MADIFTWKFLFFLFQFLFDVKHKETEVMISLEQEDMRIYREDGKENTTIGCFILRVSFEDVQNTALTKESSLLLSSAVSKLLEYGEN